jgi:hypothetical protein
MRGSLLRLAPGWRAFLAISLLLPAAFSSADVREPIQLHPPAARAEALAGVMQEHLSLTPEQAVAVRLAAEKYAGETDMALGKYQQRELRQQLKAIARARDAEFQQILTPEQFDSYKASKRSLMREMKSRMKGEAG